MKRVNHIFEKFVSMDNLRQAAKDSADKKHHYHAVKKFYENLENNLAELQTELLMGTYELGEYRIKQIHERGKDRTIYILPFRDRVVQRALGNVIDPILIRRLNTCTHASIKGRGIHSAKRQVEEYLRDVEGTQYCLKIDIRHYFQSIDHIILKEQWRKVIKDKKILALIDKIIDSVPPEEGVPIGNYFSQVAANLYLSWFDRWVKEILKIKYYMRYMDDMVFFANTAWELRKHFREIDWKLCSELHLSIKDNWQIFNVDARAVDVVGYRMGHGNTILRKKTFQNIRRSCAVVAKRDSAENLTYPEFCSVQSFKGWSMHANDATIKENYYKPIEEKLNEFQKLLKKPAHNLII